MADVNTILLCSGCLEPWILAHAENQRFSYAAGVCGVSAANWLFMVSSKSTRVTVASPISKSLAGDSTLPPKRQVC